MIEKFTFDIQAPRVRDKLVLVKAEGELRAHVVLKLLAYMIFYTPGLKVEVAVDMHYKPDLVLMGDHGVPKVWIDCGKIAIRKVESLAAKLRASKVVLVKETKSELDQFRKVIAKKVEHMERLEFLAFEKGFTAGLAESLRRTNEVTLYPVMENVIGLALNDEVFETHLYF